MPVEVANERTLRDLEFAKVKEIIKGFASSPLGREWVEELAPSANPAVIRVRLARVEELRRLLEEQGFSPGVIHDLRPILEEARQSTSLPPEEFLPILETVRAARTLRERLLALKGFPRLQEIARGLGVFRELEENIARTIDEQGELREGASPRLRELTLRRRAVEERVKNELEAILQSPAYAGAIQDAVITRRGGRLVVPIKAGARHLLDWVVQDSSDSGQTLYVEPPAVVEGNNELRELEGQIREERLRILKELTARLKLEERRLRKTLRALGVLDGLYAAARFAQEFRCASPRLNLHGHVHLISARHPLLPRASVVPIRGRELRGPDHRPEHGREDRHLEDDRAFDLASPGRAPDPGLPRQRAGHLQEGPERHRERGVDRAEPLNLLLPHAEHHRDPAGGR